MDETTLQKIETVLDEPSCYPEFARKPREQRKAELLDWYGKYGEVNICYNLFGLDRVCSVPNDCYLDRGRFRKERHDVNAVFYPEGSKFPYDYTLFMRDKLSFEMFMRTAFGPGGPYCASEAFLIGGELYENRDAGGCVPIGAEELADRFHGEKMVFKQSFGFSGDGVRVVRIRDGCILDNGREVPAGEYLKELSAPNSSWLIQRFIRQHEVLSSLNETSVNTMRIVTFHTGREVIAASAALRIGRKGADIDNVGQGGVMTGVDEEGRLAEDLFSYQDKSRLPNPFAGLQIPYFQEAKELVIAAHRFLPGLFTIGWDVAFCPEGPIIVEGNDGWDPDIAQAPTRIPLRETWEKCLEIRKNTVRVDC